MRLRTVCFDWAALVTDVTDWLISLLSFTKREGDSKDYSSRIVYLRFRHPWAELIEDYY